MCFSLLEPACCSPCWVILIKVLWRWTFTVFVLLSWLFVFYSHHICVLIIIGALSVVYSFGLMVCSWLGHLFLLGFVVGDRFLFLSIYCCFVVMEFFWSLVLLYGVLALSSHCIYTVNLSGFVFVSVWIYFEFLVVCCLFSVGILLLEHLCLFALLLCCFLLLVCVAFAFVLRLLTSLCLSSPSIFQDSCEQVRIL